MDTNIFHAGQARLGSDGFRFSWPVNRDGFLFAPEVGAQITIDAALLDAKQIKSGEMAFPYYFGAGTTWPFTQELTDLPKLLLIIAAEGLEKMTYKPGHLFVCPTSKASRNTAYQQKLKKLYF